MNTFSTIFEDLQKLFKKMLPSHLAYWLLKLLLIIELKTRNWK